MKRSTSGATSRLEDVAEVGVEPVGLIGKGSAVVELVLL